MTLGAFNERKKNKLEKKLRYLEAPQFNFSYSWSFCGRARHGHENVCGVGMVVFLFHLSFII